MRRLIGVTLALLVGLGSVVEAVGPLEQHRRQSLTGIPGVIVSVEKIEQNAERDGLIRTTLQTDVELRLRQAGIRVLTKEESQLTLSVPVLYVKVRTIKSRDSTSYAFYIAVDLAQTATLLRDQTKFQKGVTTWKALDTLGTVGRRKITTLRDEVRDMVDEFINAYLAANPMGQASAPGVSPEVMYRHGLQSYTDGNYEEAIKTFGEYLTKFPDTSFLPNAQFWFGESHYAKRDFQGAIREFNVYLCKYPSFSKASMALFKKGYAFLEVGQRTQGVATLKRLVQDFPKSREASLARDWLGKLGGKP